jgi:hypothetical protein
VEQVKYLGMTVTNKNMIKEKMKFVATTNEQTGLDKN